MRREAEKAGITIYDFDLPGWNYPIPQGGLP